MTAPPPPRSRRPLIILAAVAAAVLLVVVAVVGVLRSQRRAASTPVCTPPAAQVLEDDQAIVAFQAFAEAVKRGDQTCADSLSTGYFQQQQRLSFPGSDGQWVTFHPGDLPSAEERFQAVPSLLNANAFYDATYKRPTGAAAEGTSLTYTIVDRDSNTFYLKMGLVMDQGHVKVDAMTLEPAIFNN